MIRKTALASPADQLAQRMLRDVPAENPLWLLAALFPTRQLAAHVVQLAGSLSKQSADAVCCVDGDWRRKDLSKELGVAMEPGLSDYLSGTSSTLPSHSARGTQLEVVPGGVSPPSGTAPTLDAVRQRLDGIPRRGPWLIMAAIDHDPISRTLYATASATYLLLPKAASSVRQAEEAFRTLVRYHARVLGVVFF